MIPLWLLPRKFLHSDLPLASRRGAAEPLEGTNLPPSASLRPTRRKSPLAPLIAYCDLAPLRDVERMRIPVRHAPNVCRD